MQSINLDAILYFPWARFVRKRLMIPNFAIADITKVDPVRLKDSGIKGCVFDKDNTFTAPYKLEIYHTVEEAFYHFKEVFGDALLIDSNSAGTRDDSGYEHAKAIEQAFKVHVCRHDRKKPGGIGPVMDYFVNVLGGCNPEELAMFGDRVLTDIVFGNRYGMLTFLTALLTAEGDNKAAAKVRKYELPLLQKLISQGYKPYEHKCYNKEICSETLL